MTRILDPTNSADDAHYSAIQRLADTTADKSEINVDPLFIEAENLILSRLPAAELPEGRNNNEQRQQVALALAFYTAAFFLIGGGRTASSSSQSTIQTGELESETIGGVTRRFRGAGSSNVSRQVTSQLSTQDRYTFLIGQGDAIMIRLTGSAPDSVTPAGRGRVPAAFAFKLSGK